MNKPNIRSFDRYQELARRTQNPHLDRQGKLAHAALGLCSEVAEVETACRTGDVDSIVGEIGDVFWMLSELCDALGLRLQTILSDLILISDAEEEMEARRNDKFTPRPIRDHFGFHEMSIAAATIAGYVQKTFQGHQISPERISPVICTLYVHLRLKASYYGFSVFHAMYQNIEKLKARYPEGFSEYRSIHRKELEEIKNKEDKTNG